jgi:hypothetical protein
MVNNQRYEIPIQSSQKGNEYSNLQKGISYSIKAEITPKGIISLEINTMAPTFHHRPNMEFSATVVDGCSTPYFYNGGSAPEMKEVLAKGFDQIFRREDYPQALKNAITTTMLHLEDKFGA